MAQWVYNRTPEHCDPSERDTADILARLDDQWIIRWGFYYKDDRGQSREGDFLICGPNGHVLVLENKGGTLRYLQTTGDHEDTDERDHPMVQLDREWQSVIDRLRDQSSGREMPFIGKVLCLCNVTISTGDTEYQGINRGCIIDRQDLKQLGEWWRTNMNRSARNARESREIFMDAYAPGLQSQSQKHFITETDRIIERHTTGNYVILDMITENRQIFIQGGCGSGKTWLALEQARRWATEGSGRHVLLLCFNLALLEMLEGLVCRLKIKTGKITVRSYEGLARELIDKAGLGYERPVGGKAEQNKFFTEVVPEYLLDICRDPTFRPEYDALIVDEAQDHDTSFGQTMNKPDEPGWWGIYMCLLKEGSSSRIALFYDPAQRYFYCPESFDIGRLVKLFTQPALISLRETLRYTRPLAVFLNGLIHEDLKEFAGRIHVHPSLPTGPKIQITPHTAENDEESLVSGIIEQWISSGLCRAEQVLILYPNPHSMPSWLNQTTLGKWPLSTVVNRIMGHVGHLSVHKAKGLDSLGVILLGFKSFEKLTSRGERISYFMGASRARQLLAIVPRA
ncbi:MAG: DEAD/DEAH box helicase family protein [Verrucomicrobiota bacterium]|nr:DEAD/DEAH box helicase family protein [Verrucomicrobiota bacterium]